MKKVKIFFKWVDEADDFKKIQKEVNKWLEQNPEIEITNLATAAAVDSDAEGYFTITITYTISEDISL